MADDAHDDPSVFRLGRCPECRRDVLTAPDWDEDGREIHRCVHCDERVGSEGLRPAGAADLEAAGYAVGDGGEAGESCGSCASGGCATGGKGAER